MNSTRLSRAWERTRTVPGLGRDVTAIVVLVALGLAVAGTILAKQRVAWPWVDEKVFQADFREAPAIAPGNGQEVRIAGVTVGRISEAEVTDEGRARLTLAIEPEYEVYRDARLVLRPKTPLNDMYVEMSQGTKQAGEIEEGEVIPVTQTADPVQVDEVLSHLDERTRIALTALVSESDVALASAPDDLADGLDGAAGALDELRPLVSSLRERRETISSLVSAISQIATAAGSDDERLVRLVRSLDTTLTTLAGRDQEVRASLEQLPELTGSLKGATRQVDTLGGQLDPTLENVQTASEELPAALKQVAELAVELRQTAREAGPVVELLRPVVADLRPFVADARPAVADLASMGTRLEPSTKRLVAGLTDLQAFVYNTSSVVSLQDANGGILRGQIQVNASTLPVTTGSGDAR